MIAPIETIYKGYRFRSKNNIVPTKRPTRVDLTGKKFGRLLVIEELGAIRDANNHTSYRAWGCLCDCGNKIVSRTRELTRHHTLSCGCLNRELITERGGSNKMRNGESAFNCLFQGYKKSAKIRNYKWELTKDDFKQLTQQDCYYCGKQPSNIVYERPKYTNGGYKCNGVDRIDNTKGYAIGNVRPCCKQCNISKGVLSEDSFYEWIRDLIKQARFEHGEKG